MEFTKYNRFNNNENQVNQNLIHYKGKIGEFDYDSSIWEVIDNHLRFKNKAVTSLPKGLELPKGCVDTSEMFRYCENLTDLSPLENWDTSKIINISRMFSYCIRLKDLSLLQNWDTSNVKYMSGMFYNCEKIEDISPLQNWDTSKVEDMSLMFWDCEKLGCISPLEEWDTSNVKDMSGFSGKPFLM